MCSVDNIATCDGSNDPGELVWVEFKLDDRPSTLSEAIKEYLGLVAPRLPVASEEGETGVLPEENETDTSSATEPNGAIEEEEFVIHDSHLIEFIRSLRVKLDDISQREDDPDLYSEEERKLLETLTELLKPAMLVDGQHRVYGAHSLEMGIAFTVCALSNASWEEQVFQ